LNVLKYKDFGPEDKVWWHTFLKYKKHNFLIRDYKFGTWSLEIQNSKPISKNEEIATELVAKIKSAASHANTLLSKELKKEVDKERFWINNSFLPLKDAYYFYLKEAKKSIKKFEKIKAIEKYNLYKINQNERILSYRAYPLFVWFYSLLEFMLDVFYAFQRPSMSFFDFRSLNWQERFKKVIPFGKNSNLLGIYKELIEIRKFFRNPLTHGLTNETALLLQVPFGGLVPISYEHLNSTVHYGSVMISKNTLLKAIDTFNAFFTFSSSEIPFAYYILFVEHGISIPVEKSEIEDIKKEMTDIKSFKKYMEYKINVQDAIINRDI